MRLGCNGNPRVCVEHLLQQRRPILYWSIVLPPIILFVAAFLFVLAWLNGNIRLS